MAECRQAALPQLMDNWTQLWYARLAFGVVQAAQHQWWEQRAGAGWHKSLRKMVFLLAWALAQLLL